MRKAVMVAVMAVVAVPGAAAADPFGPASATVYCVQGEVGHCFAFGVQQGPTTMSWWLQNLQGSYGGGATPFGFQGPTVWRENPTNEDGLPVEHMQFSLLDLGIDGAIREGIPEGGFPHGGEDSFAETEMDVIQRRDYGASVGGGVLFGCALPPGYDEQGWFGGQTCLGSGHNGWITWTVQTAIIDPWSGDVLRPLVLDDVTFELGGCSIHGANSGAVGGPGCLVMGDYGSLVTTTPEPATYALLGSGLLALGGVSIVRRKRERTEGDQGATS